MPVEQHGQTRQDSVSADRVDGIEIVFAGIFFATLFLLVVVRLQLFDADREILVQHGRALHQFRRDVLGQVVIRVVDL